MKTAWIDDLALRQEELKTERYWLQPGILCCLIVIPVFFLLGGRLFDYAQTAQWPPLFTLSLQVGLLPLSVAAILGMVCRFLKITRQSASLPLGFGKPTAAMFRDALYMFGVVLVTMPLLTLVNAALMRLCRVPVEAPQMATAYLRNTPAEMLLIFFSAAILAPLAEEILFRRIIFGYLTIYFGVWSGLFCTAMIFAFFHDSVVQYPALFLLSVILQILYLRHRSLWPAVMLHAMNNATLLLVLLFFRLTKLAPPEWM